jgi:hypothetical protein
VTNKIKTGVACWGVSFAFEGNKVTVLVEFDEDAGVGVFVE